MTWQEIAATQQMGEFVSKYQVSITQNVITQETDIATTTMNKLINTSGDKNFIIPVLHSNLDYFMF